MKNPKPARVIMGPCPSCDAAQPYKVVSSRRVWVDDGEGGKRPKRVPEWLECKGCGRQHHVKREGGGIG